jgi:hydroxymethylglutaryl-CoA reductase
MEAHQYSSSLPGFYRMELGERIRRFAALTGLSEIEIAALSSEGGLSDKDADHMAENVVGVFALPLGLCVNLSVDGRDRIVPMVVEEPSVIAAASHAAKLLREGGGITSEVAPSHMVGQIQVLDVRDPDRFRDALALHKTRLLALANEGQPVLVKVGGGALDLELRCLPPLGPDDPVGTMWIVHLVVDVCDAMGANMINTMCERLAPEIAELSGGRVNLRILSNLADRRTVTVSGRVPFSSLGKTAQEGERLARSIEEASVFAERDPYRAATHNKGIMNGVDAVLVALGQDWRAVEAGAHSFAAKDGRYTALATWRVRDGALWGRLELPLAVGTVGGIVNVHPAVGVLRRTTRIEGAADLASLVAAVGLAQNLGALRALAGEGIQRGHMRLHARNVAVQAGAEGAHVDAVADAISKSGSVTVAAASEALAKLGAPATKVEASALGLAQKHLPDVLALVEKISAETLHDSPLRETLGYAFATGGKRLRAILPFAVASSLGRDPSALVPFASACEMLHNATLVHDDVQDGDTTRRGRPTVWAKYGAARAIDLGDAMFYLAVLLVGRMELAAGRREALAKRLLLETLQVIDGQEREMLLHESRSPSPEDYFRMVEGKTSAVFRLAMAGAAEACGAPGEIVRGIEESARHLGVLFQVQDDLLDIYGEKGREIAGADVKEGKRSVLAVHALTHASAPEAQMLATILDAPRDTTSDEDVRRAIAIFERTGSIAFAIDTLHERKARALDPLPDGLVKDLIEEVVSLFLEPIRPLLERHEHRTAPPRIGAAGSERRIA